MATMSQPEAMRTYGRRLLDWQVHEYPLHERTTTWYVVGAILSVGLIVYAIATANFLFAVIILMIGIITLLSTFQEPERMDVIVTTTGLVIGEAYYDFKDVKDFSIAYEPPDVKLLYVDFHQPWLPLVSIPLEEMDPNRVREVMLTFCKENLKRTEETLTDAIRRMYKL